MTRTQGFAADQFRVFTASSGYRSGPPSYGRAPYRTTSKRSLSASILATTSSRYERVTAGSTRAPREALGLAQGAGGADRVRRQLVEGGPREEDAARGRAGGERPRASDASGSPAERREGAGATAARIEVPRSIGEHHHNRRATRPIRAKHQ